ncbi:MAG: hypothetical protein FWE51_02775 [Coriobacteriia bacterium]|nr:hypothetical protein [Coriobacteriia bacterium]
MANPIRPTKLDAKDLDKLTKSQRTDLKLYEVAYWLAIALNVINLLLVLWALDDMRQGSCTAALMNIYFSVPLAIVIVAIWLSAFSSTTNISNKPRRAGMGILLTIGSYPFWIFVGLSGAIVIGLIMMLVELF